MFFQSLKTSALNYCGLYTDAKAQNVYDQINEIQRQQKLDTDLRTAKSNLRECKLKTNVMVTKATCDTRSKSQALDKVSKELQSQARKTGQVDRVKLRECAKKQQAVLRAQYRESKIRSIHDMFESKSNALSEAELGFKLQNLSKGACMGETFLQEVSRIQKEFDVLLSEHEQQEKEQMELLEASLLASRTDDEDLSPIELDLVDKLNLKGMIATRGDHLLCTLPVVPVSMGGGGGITEDTSRGIQLPSESMGVPLVNDLDAELQRRLDRLNHRT